MKTIIAAALCLGCATAHAERAFELIRNSEFRVAYHKALGPLKSEKWIAQLPGPAAEGVEQTVEGVKYILADSCKPHDCGEENLVLAYAHSLHKVYVLVRTRGKVHTLGSPPPGVAAALEQAYTERFKS